MLPCPIHLPCRLRRSSDLDASLRFYCDGLGLVLRHRQLQHNAYTSSLVGYPDAALEIAQLRLSDAEPPPSGHVLELICYERPPSGPVDLERSTIGAGHLAFVVDDVFETAARLESLGARLDKRARPDNRGDQQGRLGRLSPRSRRSLSGAAPACRRRRWSMGDRRAGYVRRRLRRRHRRRPGYRCRDREGTRPQGCTRRGERSSCRHAGSPFAAR